ncbi:hypothetical protein [Aeromonas salmonicida]|uniref:hypothetical protein n=1 Tax=Aeromonas salmonicida TaxID=645 RepID=UPI0038BCE397
MLTSISNLTANSESTVFTKALPAAINSIRMLNEKVNDVERISNDLTFLAIYMEQFSIVASKIMNDMLINVYSSRDSLFSAGAENEDSLFFFEALTFISNLNHNDKNKLLAIDDDELRSKLLNMRNYQRNAGRTDFIENVKKEFDNYYDKQIQYYTGRLDSIVKEKENDFLSLKKSIVEFDENYSSKLDLLSERAEINNNKVAHLSGLANALLESSESIHSGLNREAMAAAFKKMAGSLMIPIMFWALVFITALITICSIGVFFYQNTSGTPDVSSLLSRVFIISPIVWLAWFSGRQYGHAYKMRQDYLYKDAVAKAYHGYKTETGNEHGEMHSHLLKNIIEHFSDNPVRLYDKCEPSMPIEEFVKKISPEHILDIWKTTQNKNKEQSSSNMKSSN